MKKKNLLGFGALVFACVLTLNVKLAKINNSVDAILSPSIALASAEGAPGAGDPIWVVTYIQGGTNVSLICYSGGSYPCPI